MAERRMFSRTLLLSNAFLDLPCTARQLYFFLAVSADDEGFTDQTKMLLAAADGSEEDLQSLSKAGFIYLFPGGTVAIRHWFRQNAIRSDRFHPTVFQKERSLLTVDETGVYELTDPSELSTLSTLSTSRNDPNPKISHELSTSTVDHEKPENGENSAETASEQVSPFGNHLATTWQPRLGKERTDKKRIDQSMIGEEEKYKKEELFATSLSQNEGRNERKNEAETKPQKDPFDDVYEFPPTSDTSNRPSSTTKKGKKKKTRPGTESDLITSFSRELGHSLTPMERELIGTWKRDDCLSEELIRHALKMAVLRDARSLNYIKTVLNAWKGEGLRTVEDVERSYYRYRNSISGGG